MIRKIVLTATLALLALGSSVPVAGAFTNAPVGSSFTGSLSSPTVAIGTFTSCSSSVMGGPVVTDNGPGAGGSMSVPSVAYGNCQIFGASGTWTATLTPWGLFLGPGGGSLISVSITIKWGSLTCSYRGGLSGPYNEFTGNHVLSGPLDRVSGTSLCPTDQTFTGTYTLRNYAGVPIRFST